SDGVSIRDVWLPGRQGLVGGGAVPLSAATLVYYLAQERAFIVIFMLKSTTGAEWVNAPDEIKSTPVSATWRIVSNVIPPEASTQARLFTKRTASAIWAIVMLSSMITSAPASIASWICLKFAASTSTLAMNGACRLTALPASAIDPVASICFPLPRAASYKPIRWFVPPPMRTAYFSKVRSPGVVFLVSKTLQER